MHRKGCPQLLSFSLECLVHCLAADFSNVFAVAYGIDVASLGTDNLEAVAIASGNSLNYEMSRLHVFVLSY